MISIFPTWKANLGGSVHSQPFVQLYCVFSGVFLTIPFKRLFIEISPIFSVLAVKYRI